MTGRAGLPRAVHPSRSIYTPHGDLWLFFEGRLWTQACKSVVELLIASSVFTISRYKGRWWSAETVLAVCALFALTPALINTQAKRRCSTFSPGASSPKYSECELG